jgi:hypothetical protein
MRAAGAASTTHRRLQAREHPGCQARIVHTHVRELLQHL